MSPPITPKQLTDHLAAMKADIADKAYIPPRVLDQYRLAIEIERKCLDEERRRWEQERHRLTHYISALEYSLAFYQAETIDKYTNPEKPYVSTGNELWFGPGGQSSSRATKPSEVSPFDVSRLEAPRSSIIAESGPSNNSKGSFVMGTGISVPGIDQMREFDGILFKENIRAPPIAESLQALQSARPDYFQSVARGIPPEGSKPRSLLPSPILPEGSRPRSLLPSPILPEGSKPRSLLPSPILPAPPGQLLTESEHNPQGSQAVMKWDSSAVSTSSATPIRTDPQRLPREPFPSAAKLPSGRAHEHVPRLKSDRDSGDRELKGPLGLKNDKAGDKLFLRELHSKLNEAAKVIDALEADESQEHDSKDDVGPRTPQPRPESEVEPQLQLKPTLNFGTPFGVPHCGKGV